MKTQIINSFLRKVLFMSIMIISLCEGMNKINIIDNFVKSKDILKFDALVDIEGKVHIVYSKQEMVKDDYQHVYYDVLDSTGIVLSEQELGKYLGNPRDFAIGINSNNNAFVFFLNGFPDGNLQFFQFKNNGILKKNINDLEVANGYSSCLDSINNIYIISWAGKISYTVIDSNGNVILNQNISKTANKIYKNLIYFNKLETLDENHLLFLGTPLDYNNPNKIIWPQADSLAYCVFDKTNLEFSTPHRIKLKEEANSTFDNNILLLAKEPGLPPPLLTFKNRNGVSIIATERVGAKIGSTYEIHINSEGKIVKDSNKSLKKITSYTSTDKFVLHYIENVSGKGKITNKQQYLFGIDPKSNHYYLDKK